MNKLVVIAKNKSTYFIKRLMDEVGQGLVLFNPWEDLILPEADFYLVRTTGVYGSDLDLMLLKSLPSDRVINPLPCLELCRSKISQYLWLEQKGYAVPPWINLSDSEFVSAEKFFRLYPFALVKPHKGQGGWGIHKLDFQLFKTWWKKHNPKDLNYLLQEDLSLELEYRLFFIQGSPDDRFVLSRVTASQGVANFARGGKAEKVTLPRQVMETLENLIQDLGAYYGAIDFFVRNGTPTVIDLNLVPGLEQLESVTGENVVRKLLIAKFLSQKT